MDNGWDMGGMGCVGAMGWMWLVGFVVLVGVAVLVVVVVKSLLGRTPNDSGTGTGSGRGLEILEERYARGELSTEEYWERLRALEESGP